MVLIGLSIFFILIGSMMLNPSMGLLFYIFSGIITLMAIVKNKGWLKFLASFILAISILLTVTAFPKAKMHMEIYKKHVQGLKK